LAQIGWEVSSSAGAEAKGEKWWKEMVAIGLLVTTGANLSGGNLYRSHPMAVSKLEPKQS